MLLKVLFGLYVLLRFGEAGELGQICYIEVHNPLLAATIVFAFLFGLSVVLAGVHRLGERVAVTWHIILEILLAPLSVYFGFEAAQSLPPAGSPLAALSPDARLVLMIVLFAAAQFMLVLVGMHIVKWMSGDDSKPTAKEDDSKPAAEEMETKVN